MYAFRCKACGHLLHAGAAGERTLPYHCPVCKEGCHYGNTIDDVKKEKPHLFVGLDNKEIEKRTHTNTFAKGVSIVHFAHHENWQILADLTVEELATLGLKPEEVERHVPIPKNGDTKGSGKLVVAVIDDSTKTEDKVSV